MNNGNTLPNEELSSNIGDLFRSSTYSPSFYDQQEMFDRKNHSHDLISDPLLSSGRVMDNDNSKNGNGIPPPNYATATTALDENARTDFMRRQPADQSDLWTNGNIDQNLSTGNFDQNAKTTIDYRPPTTASTVQQRPTQIFLFPASYQSGTNAADRYRLIDQPKSIQVKSEPRDWSPDQSEYGDWSNRYQQQPATTRGAAYARDYRRKTKKRINQLEIDNQRLWTENEALKEAYRAASSKINGLEREVNYLRQILANDSTIANLLNAVVTNTSGLKFQCPLTSVAEKQSNREGVSKNVRSNLKRKIVDASETTTAKSAETENTGKGGQNGNAPGVCFHVNGEMVSVEFCSRCNRDAKRGCGDQQ